MNGYPVLRNQKNKHKQRFKTEIFEALLHCKFVVRSQNRTAINSDIGNEMPDKHINNMFVMSLLLFMKYKYFETMSGEIYYSTIVEKVQEFWDCFEYFQFLSL